MGNVTLLLSLWAEGDESVLEELMPLVYGELHQIAEYHWSGQPAGHTLQPTALIHEVYLKLMRQERNCFQNRSHFFAIASMAMRQVLVDHARARLTKKRQRVEQNLSTSDVDVAVEREAANVLWLHDALTALHAMDPRKSRVVELRYYGGLSIEETAEALRVSPVTVTRDWQAARAWLAREAGVGGGATGIADGLPG